MTDGIIETKTKATEIADENKIETVEPIGEYVFEGTAFKIYGDVRKPLFLAKEIAEIIEYDISSVHKMLASIDDDEKLVRRLFVPGSELPPTILAAGDLTGRLFRSGQFNSTDGAEENTKGTKIVRTPNNSGQHREMLFVTKHGLYELLFQSRKPIAKAFKKAVIKILDEIEERGYYVAPEIHGYQRSAHGVFYFDGNFVFDSTRSEISGTSVNSEISVASPKYAAEDDDAARKEDVESALNSLKTVLNDVVERIERVGNAVGNAAGTAAGASKIRLPEVAPVPSDRFIVRVGALPGETPDDLAKAIYAIFDWADQKAGANADKIFRFTKTDFVKRFWRFGKRNVGVALDFLLGRGAFAANVVLGSSKGRPKTVYVYRG